jgi:prolyl-tRNA editing enzyme YbaK/EbsC (Cys-tRNA(Pro) deacylase)
MADEDHVKTIAGYAIGAVPPFGHPQKLETVIDQAVLKQNEVFGGGGEINALMRVPVPELQRVTAGYIFEIADR